VGGGALSINFPNLNINTIYHLKDPYCLNEKKRKKGRGGKKNPCTEDFENNCF
jgi:hypothetical protein